VAEQRYQAVLAVISDGLSISQVAEKVGVSWETLHIWLARYEASGLEGLVDRSHRPVSCPHQMPASVEAALLELRRSRPYWGPRRLVFELAKRRVRPVPSESAAYRALVRAGMIDPSARDRRSRKCPTPTAAIRLPISCSFLAGSSVRSTTASAAAFLTA
jgi:transposase